MFAMDGLDGDDAEDDLDLGVGFSLAGLDDTDDVGCMHSELASEAAPKGLGMKVSSSLPAPCKEGYLVSSSLPAPSKCHLAGVSWSEARIRERSESVTLG